MTTQLMARQTKILFILSLVTLHLFGQKYEWYLVNTKQNKVFRTSGTGSKSFQYHIYDKSSADSVLKIRYRRDNAEYKSILDSLKSTGFKKAEKIVVMDAKLTIELLDYTFCCIDTSFNNVTPLKTDSLFKVKIKIQLSSKKEHLTKSWFYLEDYTQKSKATIEGSLTGFKSFSLIKFGKTTVYEFECSDYFFRYRKEGVFGHGHYEIF